MAGRRVRLIFTLLTVVAGMFGAGATVQAITMSPPTLEFSAKPGETINTKVKVINDQQQDVTLYTSMALFTAKDDTGQPDFKFNVPPTDLATWISADRNQITLIPRGISEINLSISVPANAEPGGHYAGFFLGTAPAQAGSQVQLQSKLGTLIILRVQGQIREQASMRDFFTFGLKKSDDGKFVAGDKQKKFNRLPVQFGILVGNQGNVHVRPKSTLTITNMFGRDVAVINMNPSEGAVLPDSVRRFDGGWAKSAADKGQGNFFSELGAEWRNFGLGTYTATVTADYGQGKKQLTSSLHFTIMPWRLLLVAILLVALLVMGLIIGLKRYNAMIIRHARMGPPFNQK